MEVNVTTALEALRPVLDAIAISDVRSPDQPVEIYFQETDDLLQHIAVHGLAEVLVDEGLEQHTLDSLPQALMAAREAQTAWTLVNERAKPQEQRELEKSGFALRAKVGKKARFSLRHNQAALAVLNQIFEGEGVADLVQDLDDLRMLLSHHAGTFARNRNFDAVATASELGSLAASIRRGLSGFRVNPEQARAVELRNRAWTHLDDLVDDVREAGRAATDGKVARGFGSAYERRRRLGARRKVIQAPAES